jgi:hypothetical protein
MNVSRVASMSAAPAPTSSNSPAPGCSVRPMREENGPSGLGWPAAEPRPAVAPPAASEPRPVRDDGTADGGKPFWPLSSDDQHTLWISFLGSIVSGVVLAVILGGAIALARVGRAWGLGTLGWLTLGFGGSCLVFIFLIWGLSKKTGRTWRWLALVALALGTGNLGAIVPFAFLGFAVLIVIWIGLAAGIR